MRQARIPYNRVSRHKVHVKQPFTASRQRETGRPFPERSDAGSSRTMEPPRPPARVRCPARNGTRFESVVRNRSDRRSVPKVPLDKKRRNISTGNGREERQASRCIRSPPARQEAADWIIILFCALNPIRSKKSDRTCGKDRTGHTERSAVERPFSRRAPARYATSASASG